MLIFQNEIIFLLSVFVDLTFVLLAFRLGKKWLYASLVVNLLLVSTFGAKLITIAGFTTNAGNVFYACVFFATHLLIEHYGKKEGLNTILIGFTSLVFFILMGQFTLQYVPSGPLTIVDGAMETLFRAVPRIAFASLLAYVFSQYVNVLLYNLVFKKTGPKHLWVRDNISNFVGQLVDSVLFFSIAFYGILPTHILLQTMLTGFAVKVGIGFLGTPLLYISYAIKKGEEGVLQSETQPAHEPIRQSAKSTWLEKLIQLGIFILIVSPVLIMGYLSYLQAQKTMDELTLSRRDTIAYLAASNLEEKFNSLTALASSYASRVQFRKFIVQGNWGEAMKIVAGAPVDFPDIDTVFLTKPDGVVTEITGTDKSAVGKSFALSDWYKGVSKEWQPYVSEMYVSANDPKKTIAVAVPIKGDPDNIKQKDRLLGILVFEIKLDRLLDGNREINIGEGGFVYFADKNGHIAGHPKYHSKVRIIDFSTVPAVQKALSGVPGVEIVYNPIDREERLVAYKKLSKYDWAVIVQQPTQAAFSIKNEALQTMLTSNGFIFLINGLLAFFVLGTISKLRGSEVTLKKTIKERNQFFNLSVDMIATAGFDGYFKELNPAWEKVTGYTVAELTAKPYIEFIHPEDRERTIKEAAKLSEGALTISFENRYLCKDGSYKWFSWNSTPVLDQKTIYAVARDITKVRKETDVVKKHSEEVERLNKLMVDRELKMVELKKKIAELTS